MGESSENPEVSSAEGTRQEIPKGSYAAGRRVRLPQGAAPPITVFVNGLTQTAGRDYEIEGLDIVFTREIIKEELGTGRKVALLLGLFGTYRKHETIDVEFSRDGKIELAGDLEVHR
jgi:hypothetical protein